MYIMRTRLSGWLVAIVLVVTILLAYTAWTRSVIAQLAAVSATRGPYSRFAHVPTSELVQISADVNTQIGQQGKLPALALTRRLVDGEIVRRATESLISAQELVDAYAAVAATPPPHVMNGIVGARGRATLS